MTKSKLKIAHMSRIERYRLPLICPGATYSLCACRCAHHRAGNHDKAAAPEEEDQHNGGGTIGASRCSIGAKSPVGRGAKCAQLACRANRIGTVVVREPSLPVPKLNPRLRRRRMSDNVSEVARFCVASRDRPRVLQPATSPASASPTPAQRSAGHPPAQGTRTRPPTSLDVVQGTPDLGGSRAWATDVD